MTASTNGSTARRESRESRDSRESSVAGLPELCDSAVRLANAIPGSLQRLSLRAGDLAVDVEFGVGAALPAAAVPALPEGPEEPVGVVVRSPLVGTYFAAPAPDADPFIRVGDQVEKGQQLAIVEAMKLMNVIPAPCAGRVLEIAVGDGDGVEYDQLLLTLDPAGSSP